jgi:hypothetical protein
LLSREGRDVAELRVERVTGVGSRVVFAEAPTADVAASASFFGALLARWPGDGAAVGVAVAAVWACDLALHFDLIAAPQRLGVAADGAVTVADRGVPLRAGFALPPRVFAADGVRVPTALRAPWDLEASGVPEAGRAAEVERRTYGLALASCVRKLVLAAQEEADVEHAAGVPIGPLVQSGVILTGPALDAFVARLAALGSLGVELGERTRQVAIASAAHDYVARLAHANASGDHVLGPPTERETAAAEVLHARAVGEWAEWTRAPRAVPAAGGGRARRGWMTAALAAGAAALLLGD